MKQLLELSVIALVIVRLSFLCTLQGDSIVGQTSGQMNFSHKEGGSNSQLQKRSFGDGCLEELKISWLRTVPFVYDIGDNRNSDKKSGENTLIMKGIFVDVVKNASAVCWQKFCGGSVPQVRYLRRATTLKGLQLDFLRGSANMIIPVYSEEAKYGGAFPFVKILDSPGVVLIQRYSTIYQWKLVLKAVLGTWPIVVMAFLMSFVAGFIIWLLDSSHNSEQFSPTFHRGVFQGFWWAFVTITTVGYGDKTPKSTVARSFAVVWMTVGVTICSVMTASLSSTLTSVKLERDDLTAGKRIGLLKDGVAFQDAISLAANITSFEDSGEMYDSLVNGRINGILMELLSGTEFIKARDMSKQLFVAKTIWRKRSFGVVYNDYFLNKNVSECLSTVIKFSHNDALKIASKYTRATEGASDGLVIKVFDYQSKTFLICVGVLSLLPLVCLISGRVVIFMTNHLNSEQKTDELSVGQNDSESKDAENSSSVLPYEKQQTEV